MTDIFRPFTTVSQVGDKAMEIGSRYIWMQGGLIHEEAARKAEVTDILVTINNRTMREHLRRYGGMPAWQGPPYF